MTGRHGRSLRMRRWRRAAVLTLSVALAVGVWGSAASADNLAVSQPNGDFGVWVGAGSATDRDGDGNDTTATFGDIVSCSYTPYDRSGVTQTIEIEWVLDAPGTELDRTGTNTVVLEPYGFQRVVAVSFKLQRNVTPLGEYRFTVTATGSDTETATTTGTFTVLSKG